MKIYAGTSGFAHAEWKGSFYPEKISPKEMLRFYAERIGSVEINNTFYHMPKENVLATWSGQVPEGFVFAVKAPQVITHFRQLRNVRDETEYLFRALKVLDKKQGPVLFQFPKSFRLDRDALEEFLPLIPGDAACAFDFRNLSWHTGEIHDLLRKKGCGWCIEDTDENPVRELVTTAAWGYLRLRRSDYTDADLEGWLERISSQEWERAFVYFKHEEKGADLAMRFRKMSEDRAALRKAG